ncbi:hypothetical protein GCM10009763_05090 [Dermacoccus profundi]|uniref:Uncharacterized protein n=2 Tax=Dermacoccus TaxID=57495 RepID=A0ABN2C1J9_9MICO
MAVLDLGDVLELRRQTVHTAQSGALFTLDLVTVVGVDDKAAVVVDNRCVVAVRKRLGSAGKEVGGVALVQG